MVSHHIRALTIAYNLALDLKPGLRLYIGRRNRSLSVIPWIIAMVGAMPMPSIWESPRPSHHDNPFLLHTTDFSDVVAVANTRLAQPRYPFVWLGLAYWPRWHASCMHASKLEL